MIYEINLTVLKACILASLFPFIFIFLKKASNKYIQPISLVAFLIISILLGSRAMLFSVSAVYVYLNARKFSFIKPLYLLSCCLISGLILLIIKFDSSTGRFFIWQNIFSNIQNVPLNGFGYESFKEIYSGWQSEFFQSHTEWSRFHLVADSPSYAFNEFLHYYIEFGPFAGFILVLLLVFNIRTLIGKNNGNEQYFALSNIVIFLFSTISYPLHSVWILSLFIFNHVSIAVIRFVKLKTGLVITITGLLLFASPFILYQKDQKAVNLWEEARYIPLNYTEEKSVAFQTALKKLSNNQYFLNDYCRFLLFRKSTDSVLNLTGRYKKHMNQYEYYTVVAESYRQKENYDSTKKYLLSAHYIIPNRFIPVAQLMELEIEYGNIEKAKEFANIILQMPVKISSPKVDFIKSRASEILQKTYH